MKSLALSIRFDNVPMTQKKLQRGGLTEFFAASHKKISKESKIPSPNKERMTGGIGLI
jgi:hypothetical protein